LASKKLILGWLLLVLVLLHWLWQPMPAWGLSQAPETAQAANAAPSAEGGRLFASTCAGCHVNGGNIVRRDRTLKLNALRRHGIEGPKAVATIAAEGIGRMDGYAKVLGPEGAELVGEWVWKQALENWPKVP
jgi:cytochrome c6